MQDSYEQYGCGSMHQERPPLGSGSVPKAKAGVDALDSLPGDETALMCMQSLHTDPAKKKKNSCSDELMI